MPNKTRGVGLFTAENIVAVLRAIPRPLGRSQVPKGREVLQGALKRTQGCL